jgi:hypothetical protein
MSDIGSAQWVSGFMLVLTLAACGASNGEPGTSGSGSGFPSGSGSFGEASGVPFQARSVSGPFVLTLQSPRDIWEANKPIELVATLAYQGESEAVALAGSGSGLIGFSIKELTGQRAVMGAQTSDCRFYQMQRLVPITTHYIKSGGITETDPDPAWIRSFLQDRLFRLPAGRWEVTAYSDFFEQTCGMDQIRHQIRVSLELTVR